jgi:hypothetical protein
MTTPEDRDLWERDEEALRTPAPVDPMRSEAARVARYAEAIWKTSRADEGTISATGANIVARAVIRIADDETARLRRGAKTLGETIEKQCRMVLDATGLHDWVDEEGDGDWGAIWDHLFALRARVEDAEARVERLNAALDRARMERAQAEDAETVMASRAEAAEAKVAKVEPAAAAVIRAWDESVSYEPCADCLRSGVALLTFDSDNAMDDATDALRAALADAPAERQATTWDDRINDELRRTGKATETLTAMADLMEREARDGRE